MQSDTGYSSGRPQNVNAYLVEQKRLQLQKRGPAPRGQSASSSYNPPPLTTRSSEPLARYEAKPAPLPVEPKKVKASAPVGKGIEEKDLASAASTNAEAVTTETKSEAVALKEDTTAKMAEPVKAKSGCEEGKEAREAAANSSDDSDKLFHLRKALRLCPNSAETHYDLGKAYLHMDRAADASYEFKQSLSIDPSFKAAQESLKEMDQGKTHY
jgi:tetratricopeptide (TPR) repeat protein